MLKNTLILGLIGVVGMANAADLITNGGFEEHPLYVLGLPTPYYNTPLGNPVVGWFSDSPVLPIASLLIPIEVGEPDDFGVSGDSSHSAVQLNSGLHSELSQLIFHATGQLQLSFDFAKTAFTFNSTNDFKVLWDGKVVDTIDPTSTKMTTISPITVTADGLGLDKLTFEATGTPQGIAGGVIDNVHLMGNTQAVPEPISMTLLGMGAAALLRRKRS